MTRWRSFSTLVERHASLIILLLFCLLTLVMTWPVVAQLRTHVPGGTVDLWTHRWTYWWIKHAIAEGHTPFFTDLLFHPQGVSLAFHNIAWVNIALWLPLQVVLGGNAAYSLTFLIFCALNGFAMYLLARELACSFPAAFVSGLVYGFWPYTMSQFGHPNMKVTCWVPLALLYLRRTLDERQAKDALLAALFLALTGLTRWQLLLMALVLFGLYLTWDFLRDRAHWTKRTVGLLALTGLVAMFLMAPLAFPVASKLLNRDDTTDVLFTEVRSGQTDLLAYVLPTPYHPLWHAGFERFYENFVHNRVFVPFLGYTVLGLALCGALRRWGQGGFWLLVAGVYVALALGPQLRVNGQLYPGVPMPYRLIRHLFIVRAIRVPNRFNLFLGIPVAMLASLGVEALTHRRSRLVSGLSTVVLGGLILLEYSLVPYHTEHPVTPDWFEQLAREPDEAAVLDLPLGLQTYNKRYMFYQITHQKPLVEGKIARPPREAFAFFQSSPFLRELRERNVMDPDLVDISHQLSALAEANVRYIVLHRDFATPDQLRAWRDWLTFAPVYHDEDVIVYRTDPQWDRDFVFSHPLTERIGLVRASTSPLNAFQGDVVRVDARWGSSGVPGEDYDVCLGLVDGSGTSVQSHCVPVSPTWPPSRWKEDELVRDSYTLRLPDSLEPGEYSVSLTLSDADDGSSIGRSADLGTLQVDPLRPAYPSQSTFGERIQLLGFDLEQTPDVLSVTVYWQALQAMETSYKTFVHITDPVSEEIVVQADFVPCDWMYPTNHWIQGEVVQDTVQLRLEDISAGRYALTVGWYDSNTGQRLEARKSGVQRYPNDAAPLMPIEVE